jgi:hippurate hydrolase
MKGDARALSKETSALIEKNMRQIVKGICDAHGVKSEVSYETTIIPTFNSSQQTEAATNAARNIFGDKNTDDDCLPRLFSEDFSIMSEAKPGCFVLMGNGTKGSHSRPLHSPNYDFNDELLVIGSSYWTELVEQQLK